MSTGLTLLGFILYNIFLTCSNVGLWTGLFFLHFLISCDTEREWEKQTAFCHFFLVLKMCVKPYLQLVKNNGTILGSSESDIYLDIYREIHIYIDRYTYIDIISQISYIYAYLSIYLSMCIYLYVWLNEEC